MRGENNPVYSYCIHVLAQIINGIDKFTPNLKKKWFIRKQENGNLVAILHVCKTESILNLRMTRVPPHTMSKNMTKHNSRCM